jgi:Raf kinase inhibitor-like YbhB/YbcL family protein
MSEVSSSILVLPHHGLSANSSLLASPRYLSEDKDLTKTMRPALLSCTHSTALEPPMRIYSNSFHSGDRIPGEFAFGVPGVDAPMAFGGNRNPHLAWDDVPVGTRSFALICVDDDVPSVFDDGNQAGRTIAHDLPRVDFIHWLMTDITSDVREIASGSCSDQVVAGGKRSPSGPAGCIQGINDYTAFMGDGDYYGYDGPCPPWNDERLHHYHFRLFALDVPTLGLSGRFTAADALAAMQGHVLGSAELTGTYTLNPAVQ